MSALLSVAAVPALRHSHIPVDLITDEDIAEGLLLKFKVLYLVGQELSSNAVPALERWVRDGEALVAAGGGGLLNEYREPMPGMYRLCGVENANLNKSETVEVYRSTDRGKTGAVG